MLLLVSSCVFLFGALGLGHYDFGDVSAPSLWRIRWAR